MTHISNRLDLDVGYSPSSEDLNMVDTEYVLPTAVDFNEDSVNIMHLNVRGLINKQDSLLRLLEALGGQNKVSIVSLNETWLRTETIAKIDISGYNYVGKCREGRKGGGVGVLLSEELRYREISKNLPRLSTLEYICVEIMMKKRPIVLLSLYRPPNQSLTESISDIRKLLDSLDNKNKDLVICSDYNLDLLKMSDHSKTMEFVELLSTYNLYPTITKPTRLTHTTATLIDNIFVGKEHYDNYKSMLILDDLSDHLPCLLSLTKVELERKQPELVWKRSLKERNIKKIELKLRQTDWNLTLENKSCEDAFNTFHDRLLYAIDECAPEKPVKRRPTRENQPWITSGLKKCVRKQRELYKTYLEASANIRHKEAYKKYKACLQKVIRNCKRTYYSDLCEKYRNNTKRLWEVINSIVKRVNHKTNIIDCLEINDIKCFEAQEIVNELGKHFSSIGKLYAEKTKDSEKTADHYISKIESNCKTMFLNPTDCIEVEGIINKLKNKYSSGHDNISNFLVKQLKNVIVLPLTIIINKSLQEGHFPDRMKMAEVVPLHKGKERSNKNNYRPISLLLTISKILEKIVYIHTYTFMERTNQFYEGQYGFRTKHSCENAVQNLLSDIVKSESLKKITKVVYLDLSKAFDTLSHPILFKKLYKYGIRGNSLEWFMNYLSNRNMSVKCATSSVQTIYSDLFEVEYGAPQGSCLGPLLFSIFTNDISKHLIYTKCILFADDTTIYMSHKNEKFLNWCIEEDIKIVSDWFKANLLTLNLDKTVYMTFRPKKFTGIKKFLGSNIQIDGISIPEVKETKFLGIWIDNSLNWNSHLCKLFVKLKRNVNLLRVSKHTLNIHAKKSLYYAQIYSHLSYGLIVWGNMISQCSLTKLQRIQNKCFKLIFGCEATVDNYHSFKLLRLSDMIKIANLKHGHKVQYSHLPERILLCNKTDNNDRLLVKDHRYPTRNKGIPNLPFTDCLHYRRSFLYQSILIYQHLPLSLKSISSESLFVNRCKELIYTGTI